MLYNFGGSFYNCKKYKKQLKMKNDIKLVGFNLKIKSETQYFL